VRQRQGAAGHSWFAWLGLVTGVGLGVRLATVLGRHTPLPHNDAYFYHASANLLAAGLGFINPFDYDLHGAHQHVATAAFPPMFTFALFPASLAGFTSFFAHQVWSCVIGAAGVALCGIAGREIAGDRAGLVAAAIAAVYPNLWISDALVMSEALTPAVVALVLWAAYRFWRRPRPLPALALGAAVGVAALSRDELSLLVPFVVLPLALLARLPWRRRLVLAGAGALASALVVAPWVGYNLSRFKEPTFISTGLGVTLVSANCRATWYGPDVGYWSFPCALHAPIQPKSATVDESVQDLEGRHIAWRFITAHPGRIPAVALARIGRTFGLFHPLEQIRLDVGGDGRPYRWALIGLGTYYALCVLAVGGVVSLRRRGVPVFPLLAVGAVVVMSVVVTFGQTRYRSPFEVSLVLLAAAAIDHAAGWLGGRRAARRAFVTGWPPRLDQDGSEPAAAGAGQVLPATGSGHGASPANPSLPSPPTGEALPP